MRKLLPKTANNPDGFTLIELLVVISIIAILSTIGFIVYQGVQKKGRDTRRKADLAQVKTYLELYYNDNHQYPAGSFKSSSASTPWISGFNTYTSRLPTDPINSGTNVYSYGNVPANGQSYSLNTILEDANDPDRCGVKDWRYIDPSTSIVTHWCAGDSGTFGGTGSNQLYEVGSNR